MAKDIAAKPSETYPVLFQKRASANWVAFFIVADNEYAYWVNVHNSQLDTVVVYDKSANTLTVPPNMERKAQEVDFCMGLKKVSYSASK